MTNLLRTVVWAAAISVSSAGMNANTAFAVLGETEAQLIERYGQPTAAVDGKGQPPAERVVVWRKTAGHGIALMVFLIGGRSARQVYILTEAVEEPAADIVKQLLNENADGDSWKIIPAYGLNTLESMKANLSGKEHKPYKFYYAQNRNQNQSHAFILQEDPRQLEVLSAVWIAALK